MDLLRPLLEAGLVEKVGSKKTGTLRVAAVRDDAILRGERKPIEFRTVHRAQ